jgi:hypothetical protein
MLCEIRPWALYVVVLGAPFWIEGAWGGNPSLSEFDISFPRPRARFWKTLAGIWASVPRGMPGRACR